MNAPSPENMPILYRNALDSLPSDFARDVWLWAAERPGMDPMCYKADRFAIEADKLVRDLMPMLDASAGIHGLQGHDPELMSFFLKRHANWRFGGNLSPPYAESKT
jgi:hypothetical protein